jgi:phosphoribosylformimino-5-aminoimidazole carboxamide ribotide isomerase
VKENAMGMRIWPAIDLLGSRCVRLRQGDYEQETQFSDDPVAVAKKWIAAGSDCLHLVDLDAAKNGNQVNRSVIADIIAATGVECQVGGGVRDDDAIASLLSIGASRLVVGTSAVKNPEWFSAAAKQYPGKLVLGVDARDGFVATDGWLETSQLAAEEFVQRFADLPLAGIVYTDIARDGMMQGPNVEAMQSMATATSHPVIASGGVTSHADIPVLAKTGVAGAIIGRALYEGEIDLAQAIAQASGPKGNPASTSS